MTTMASVRKILLLLGVVILVVPVDALVAKEYQVSLKDGSVFTTDYCYEKGETFYIQKYGGYLGFHKKDIKKIEEVEAEGSVMIYSPSEPSNQNRSAGRTSSGRKTIKNNNTAVKDEREEKIKKLEKRLTLTRNSMRIECGRMAMPPERNNGPIAGERAGAIISSRFKSSQACDYYKHLVPELEKQLEEARRQ